MTEKRPEPPVARRDEQVREIHGRKLVDHYGWLRSRDSAEVRAHLEAENAYTDSVLAPSAELRKRLYDEILGRIKETDSSAPYRRSGFWYYTRTEKGRQYPIWCRRRGTMESPEEVLLDGNVESSGKPYFAVGSLAVSPDGTLLAYGVDVDGSERHRVSIREIASGHVLETLTDNGGTSAVWSADGRTLFYNTLDDTRRPFRLHRHALGTDPVADPVVFEEPDGRFFLFAGPSLDRTVIFVGLKSNTTSEFRWFPADEPLATPRLMQSRREEIEYYPEHRDGEFFIRTNDEAMDFKIVARPVDACADGSRERVVLPHIEGVRLAHMELFRGHLAVFERERGLDRIRILDLATLEDHVVAMPDEVYALDEGRNAEFETTNLRFHYSSPIMPDTAYDYDMAERAASVVKRQEIPSGHDPAAYECHRLWVPSHDGVDVPVTVFHRKGVALDGSNPAYLYGYGSYGITVEPRFRSSWYSLADRGFVCAVAHVRGGGMLGEAWYKAGKLANKRNTFLDFVAAAEYLVGAGYTSAGRLAIQGGSAGGLLMGAVLNMRPDLFGVAVADVPFVDIVNTMLDESIPLTVTEYEEWGNPNTAEAFDTMLSYSPYDNVTAARYPDLLVTAGLNDPRVQYWEPAKWVARLRATAGSTDRVVLLKTNMGAGHGGPSGRYEAIREQAMAYAFIIARLGVAGA